MDPTKVGSVGLKDAAMLTVGDYDNDGEADLLISSFTGNPFASGSVHIIRNVSLLSPDQFQPELLADKLTWPNEIKVVPPELEKYFGSGIFIPDGFLVSGKTTGAIRFLGSNWDSNAKVVTITEEKKDYFYHRIHFKDMNNDGAPDIITSRATKPAIGDGEGEFLWLENPNVGPIKSDSSNTPWVEHILMSDETHEDKSNKLSPDIFTDVADFDGDGIDEIVAANFFNEKVEMLFAPSYGEDLQDVLPIDTSIGPVFDAKIVDVNGDGKKDILVTNHVNDPSTSGIYVYEFICEADGQNSRKAQCYKRHDLYTGFVVKQKGIGQAAPGEAILVYPQGDEQERASILVSGDGAQKVFLLVPTSSEESSWDYTLKEVDDYQATVGSCVSLTHDTKASGASGFICANYNKGKVEFYQY